ncbi:hypothetical protein [Streptomyces sp. NPDC006285]|uniref:hypothetical protein n=1 Tax=Streptomyces sp. NPDC006285 TaxID=3364742 RepID=UPI0036BB6EE3
MGRLRGEQPGGQVRVDLTDPRTRPQSLGERKTGRGVRRGEVEDRAGPGGPAARRRPPGR